MADSINSGDVRWDLPKNAEINSRSHSELPFRSHVFSSTGLRRGAKASFLIRDSVFLTAPALVLEVNLVGVGEDYSGMMISVSRQNLGSFERDRNFIKVFEIDPGNKDAPIVPGGDTLDMEAGR
ncbi:hypothetical protein U8335_20535 [Roseiconus lacunae]|uniref:hypothetical protein n=1 Tax=Roseiconus lacunae TaxID=2605694 RepID=UPI00308F5A21|nr:hypothetical protein U8335_20535 [Stieleria sp. HD01]